MKKSIGNLAAAFAAFFRLEPAAGVLLFIAAVAAMLIANSGLAGAYEGLINLPIRIRLGPLDLHKPLVLWVNDGLMAIFFFMIGMEVKLEMTVGALADLRKAMLPAIAALGGMLAPAVIYFALNSGDPVSLRGWAVPTATDIAFSLGLLTLAGSRIPNGLKVFLMTLAIFDDLGAIVIIATFYSSGIQVGMLLVALLAISLLAVMSMAGVMRLMPYLVAGTLLWLAVLKSGVHATLAGVALGLFIPLGPAGTPEERSPLHRALKVVHPWVAFGILPLFAFMNSGVSLHGLALTSLLQPVPLGIALGLVVGKQLGVFGFSWLALRSGIARLPERVSLMQLYGVSLLCGVGFTMSVFIGSLAFDATYDSLSRLGILLGSLLSGLWGFTVLRCAAAAPALTGDTQRL